MTAHYDDLKDKTFLVTGASSGIGRAVALALAEQGASVVLTGRNKERLEAVRMQAGTGASCFVADLVQPAERDSLIDFLPALDGVCHAAGIIDPFPIRYLDESRFNKVFDINAKAPILLTAQLLRKKKVNRQASIVFISSISSNRAMKGGSVYSASKSAIEAFSRTLNIEHSAQEIRSNCIKAGLVQTNILEKAASLSAAVKNSDENNIDSGFIGSPDNIAAAVLFLLSGTSAFTKGTNLVLDGGHSTVI